MYLDSNSAPGGGGGDKPERVEIVSPFVGALILISRDKGGVYGVGLTCCADDATDEEILGKFRQMCPEDDKVKWDHVVRKPNERAPKDDDYNCLMPRCCESDKGRRHMAVLSKLVE